MIELYDFAHGARGLRVAWLCEELGVPHTFKAVTFPPGDAYKSINPFGSVPALVDQGFALSESIAMMLYVAAKHGSTTLLPTGDQQSCGKVMQFALYGEASLAAAMAPLLTARYGAPAGKGINWSVDSCEASLKRSIGILGDSVGEAHFLVGASLTIADISVVTALRIWTRGLAKELPGNLVAYCNRHEERAAFKRALAAHC